MSVSQGFFGDTVFRLHPHLNCLVGGKGTGKSTTIEFLRYVFKRPPKFDDLRADCLSKALALVGLGGTISVTCADDSGQEFIVERTIDAGHDSEPVCRDSDGEVCAIPFIPTFFSQGELARIASSPFALLELIDDRLDLH